MKRSLTFAAKANTTIGAAALVASFALACSESGTGSNPAPPSSSGGAPTGGMTSTGGVISPSTGGLVATGGTTGGAPPSGGQAGSTGGSVAAGGQTQAGSGGIGGTSGAASGGGGGGGQAGSTSDASCKSIAPATATATTKFPFPQHRFAASCTYPTSCNDADVTAGWQHYKERLIVDGGNGTLRVRRPENSDDTVSEGISYGMLFAVYMDDKDTFDKLWAYAQAHFDDKGLMHWQIRADGSVQGRGSATDSDEDIGFSLVMADKQWGGYTEVTKDYLGKVLANDFTGDGTIRGGDGYDDVNPSYLAPAFYRTFAAYTGEQRWMQVLDKAYETLNGAANSTTGLVPDWSSGSRGGDYKYDAARTPYRIGLDACWNDEPRAKAYSQKIGAFFAGVGADNIRDAFQLDGTITGENKNSTFIGPAGVAGMAAGEVQLVNDSYAQVAMDLQAGTESYYNLSWALFTGLMMTGNFVDLAAID